MKEIKKTTYYFDKFGRFITEVTFEDDSELNVIIEFGSITVCQCSLEEFNERMDDEDFSYEFNDKDFYYEFYDTADGNSYYLDSKFAEIISDSLVDLANRSLRYLSK